MSSPSPLTPADILAPDGRVAQRLPRYEPRPQQLAMADAVQRAIEGQFHLMVEAGTGVGKSFAYLVPAILQICQRDGKDHRPRRVVVSTHTISLQEQLIGKDLPLLNSVIPLEFSALLVKGRRNYISLRRLASAVQRSASLFHRDEHFDQLDQIGDWSEKTRDGSLSDLPYAPQPIVWDEVASDTGNCMGRKCPRYKECFYYLARRRVQHAHILVVNHALLFSDLALRRQGAQLLPDYDVAIIDEAHTMEAIAGEHLGLGVSSSQVDYVLNRLYNDRTQKGLLVHHRLQAVQQQVDVCRDSADTFFGDLDSWLSTSAPSNGRMRQGSLVDNPLSPQLDVLAKQLKVACDRLTSDTDKQDFHSAAERLRLLADDVEAWRTQARDDVVYWLQRRESRRGLPRLTMAAAPVDVGPTLREQLFDRVATVVMTSATLSVGRDGSFDYFRSRTGLSECETLRLGSPFDYQRQAELVTLTDMPEPTSEREEYEQQVVRQVKHHVARTDGRAFVLFTSYDMMKRVAAGLAPWLASRNLRLLSQADGVPRTKMLEDFKENPRTVLCGTDSFWQGIDVPGDALALVIITKLPFSVPDHPLLEARLESIRASGGNPFLEYQLPQAIIKLKQGFGRLIRSGQDEGTVVILDPRISSKSYGRLFLDSLPECRVRQESALGLEDVDCPSP